MPARMYYDNDADPSALAGQTVAVIGYGSQGHAHAQNLHDSGIDVVVGLAPGSKSRAHAEKAGLRVADVAGRGARRRTWSWSRCRTRSRRASTTRRSRPTSSRARCSCSPTASTSGSGASRPDAGIDVGMVAPKGPGHLLRSVYVAGGGVPALFAVEQDATGTARARVLAYARGTRLDARGRPRDDLQGGDRDRPVRGAGAPVRWRLGAHQGGLRDARGGGLPAGARLLRDDARAQAHRRPDVPRRPQLHALQRHRTPPSTATTSAVRASRRASRRP